MKGKYCVLSFSLSISNNLKLTLSTAATRVNWEWPRRRLMSWKNGLFASLGHMVQDPLYCEWQLAQWDIEKQRNKHVNCCLSSFFYVPLLHLPSSLVNFVPCGHLLQRRGFQGHYIL